MTNKRQDFLEELAALTKKYGAAINSCGCCSGVWTSFQREGVKDPNNLSRLFANGKGYVSASVDATGNDVTVAEDGSFTEEEV